MTSLTIEIVLGCFIFGWDFLSLRCGVSLKCFVVGLLCLQGGFWVVLSLGVSLGCFPLGFFCLQDDLTWGTCLWGVFLGYFGYLWSVLSSISFIVKVRGVLCLGYFSLGYYVFRVLCLQVFSLGVFCLVPYVTGYLVGIPCAACPSHVRHTNLPSPSFNSHFL